MMPTIRKQKLAGELLSMMAEDQKIIILQDEKEFKIISKKHVTRLKEIISKNGWPTISDVGWDGARAAWLIAQHADTNKSFQRSVLKLMKDLYSRQPNEVIGYDIAYLEDRVRINAGKKQIYGTQLRRGANGDWKPKPLQKPGAVNTRRACFGMPPIEEYIKGHEKAVKKFFK